MSYPEAVLYMEASRRRIAGEVDTLLLVEHDPVYGGPHPRRRANILNPLDVPIVKVARGETSPSTARVRSSATHLCAAGAPSDLHGFMRGSRR